MKVHIVNATPNPMHAISAAAGMCYGKTEYSKKRVERCLINGHTSVAEHVSATFRIEGISRSCLAQLTRHRMASFSVMSQRYCTIEGDDWYVMPRSFADKGEEVMFEAAMDRAQRDYLHAIEKGIKPEDARFLLPEATKTNLATKPADELLCSECGEHVDIAYMENADDYHARFCPNCGAEVVEE